MSPVHAFLRALHVSQARVTLFLFRARGDLLLLGDTFAIEKDHTILHFLILDRIGFVLFVQVRKPMRD